MLYDAPYEADLADRVGAPGPPCTVVGKHCESGDVLIRETQLPEPRPGDVLAMPVTGAYVYAMANNYNGVPRAPVVFCSGGERARSSCAARPSRTCMPETFRVGLLGHGTVGARVRGAAGRARGPRRGDHRPAPGGQRACSRARAGTSRRSSSGSDLIVELIGGIDPARDYVLRAMQAGKHVVSANKLLLASHGEELWSCAREHGVQLRFEGAVAGVVPVIRVLQETLAAAHVERIHGIVNGTTNFILTEMARGGHVLRARRWPARRSSATPRPTRPTTSPAATPRPRWRSSPGWRSPRRSRSTR